MKVKAEKILRKYKNKRVGVFIDDANMFHAQREVGWVIDWKKFKNFLEANFRVKFIRHYIGIYPEGNGAQKSRKKNELFAKNLQKIGLKVVKKPLKKIYLDRAKTKFKYKCDFDAEIGFDIGINVSSFDLAIVVSGDSDFIGLARRLPEYRKHFLMICFKFKAPWEVYKIHHFFVEDIKDLIEKTQKKPR